jgi:hypothetical protein
MCAQVLAPLEQAAHALEACFPTSRLQLFQQVWEEVPQPQGSKRRSGSGKPPKHTVAGAGLGPSASSQRRMSSGGGAGGGGLKKSLSKGLSYLGGMFGRAKSGGLHDALEEAREPPRAAPASTPTPASPPVVAGALNGGRPPQLLPGQQQQQQPTLAARGPTPAPATGRQQPPLQSWQQQPQRQQPQDQAHDPDPPRDSPVHSMGSMPQSPASPHPAQPGPPAHASVWPFQPLQQEPSSQPVLSAALQPPDTGAGALIAGHRGDVQVSGWRGRTEGHWGVLA